jgi:hypothetical protein
MFKIALKMGMFSFLFLSISTFSRAEQPQSSKNLTVQRTSLLGDIKKILPAGWKVSTQKTHLLVQREKEVKVVNLINAESNLTTESEENYMLRHSHNSNYHIVIDLGNKFTLSAVQKAQQENKKTRQKMQNLEKQMPSYMKHKRHIFNWRTAADRELFNKHEQLSKTLQKIPEYCEENFSASVFSLPAEELIIYPEEVAKECEAVLSQIKKLFKRPCSAL